MNSITDLPNSQPFFTEDEEGVLDDVNPITGLPDGQPFFDPREEDIPRT